MENKHEKYQRLIDYCKALAPLPTAVVHPCDDSSLAGAISPGPLQTRAASGLKDIMDVGYTCAFLATPLARRLSGETLYVDGGVNIMA
jgi:enoyl-[acyl-carrier-protein] reductase (NADH)